MPPAEKFLGRIPASTIPMKAGALITANSDRVRKDILGRRQRQKRAYDEKARPLPPLTSGQSVRVQPTDFTHEWKTATCIDQINPRMYRIRTQDGTQLVRNRKHLAIVPQIQPKSNAPSVVHRVPAQTTKQGPAPRRVASKPGATPCQKTRNQQQAAASIQPRRSERKRTANTPVQNPWVTRIRANSAGRPRTPTNASESPMDISTNNNQMQREDPTIRTTRSGRPVLTPARLKL